MENSIGLYVKMLETPALCTLDVKKDYAWGDDLINTQFLPPVNPIFSIDLKMNKDGAHYSKNLEMFGVSIVETPFRRCFFFFHYF